MWALSTEHPVDIPRWRVLVAHVQLLDWGANIWEREKARLGVLGVLGCMNNISLPL